MNQFLGHLQMYRDDVCGGAYDVETENLIIKREWAQHL